MFTTGENNADYVNANGKYDIIKFLTNHRKDFNSLYNVAVEILLSRIKTGIYCESLFSQAVHLSHPNCIRNTVDTF